jgi:hypothetical protein
MTWVYYFLLAVGLMSLFGGIMYDKEDHRQHRFVGTGLIGVIIAGLLNALPWYVTKIVFIIFGIIVLIFDFCLYNHLI